MRTTEITIYKFNELSEEVQKKVIEKNYDINIDYRWWDFIEEDAKDVGKLMGIEITNILFSGFSSQGDGACFEGHYYYAENAVEKVKEYAPKDKALINIAASLDDIQKRNGCGISAHISHSGHYYHENCTLVDVELEDGELDEVTEEDVTSVLRYFMQWIYAQLQDTYEYLTSEEAIVGTIEANGYEFDEYENIFTD